MHDPMVVLFDVHVPIPSWRSKSMKHEPRWGVRAFRRTNPENRGSRDFTADFCSWACMAEFGLKQASNALPPEDLPC